MTSVIDLMESTVRIEQAKENGAKIVGTGFVVLTTDEDGAPRTVLITAAHVFWDMVRDKVTVNFRERGTDGVWRPDPVSVRIRNAKGNALWTSHPTQDVAAIELPAGVSPKALPARELPGERALEALGVDPGDEMMVLGYPRGLSANPAGFPILRSGRVASYPLSPAEKYPTYMLDFSVFAGNSGGPVYVVTRAPQNDERRGTHIVVTGLLTQQVKLRGDRLAIGNVTQADFISETLELMDNDAPALVTAVSGGFVSTDPALSTTPRRRSPTDRLRDAWSTSLDDARILVQRTWIVVRDWAVGLLTPDARRA